MPFYLVTYTGLVEAEDEVGAAEKVMENLRVETRMTFTVKLDENSIKHVSVTRRTEAAHDVPFTQPTMDPSGEMSAKISGLQTMQPAEALAQGVTRPVSSAGVIGAVFLALSFAACCVAGLLHFAPFRLF